MLINRLEGRPVSTTDRLLPCHLVMGGSTGVRRPLAERVPLQA